MMTSAYCTLLKKFLLKIHQIQIIIIQKILSKSSKLSKRNINHNSNSKKKKKKEKNKREFGILALKIRRNYPKILKSLHLQKVLKYYHKINNPVNAIIEAINQSINLNDLFNKYDIKINKTLIIINGKK